MGLEMPTTRDLAALVFSTEHDRSSDLYGPKGAAERIFDKLRVHLSARLGAQGYRAILNRAVKLASTDFPWLISVRISDDGSFSEFDSVNVSEAIFDGCVSVLAKLIELLETLIGRNLTVRMLHSAWPTVIRIDAADWPGENNG